MRHRRGGGSWPSLRPRRWSHWTLRSRLVLVVAALAAVALLGANAAGLLLLRSSLTSKVDEQLRAFAGGINHSGNFPPRPGGPDGGQAFPDNGQTQPPAPSDGGEQQSSTRPTRFDQVRYFYDAQGQLESDNTGAEQQSSLSPPRLGSFAELTARVGRGPFTVDAQDGGDRWRVIVVSRDGGGLAVLAASMQNIDATADSLLLIDAIVTGLVLILLGGVAAWVVRLGLGPLTRMERAAAEITAGGDLTRRLVDVDSHTEPGRLGVALNSMLGRIGSEVTARRASEQRLRQFIADASHELRTPLTSIRGFAELYRRGGAPPGPQLDETMSRIEGEAARMGLLVDDLLLLAQLDLQRPMDRRPVDLLAIAADTIRDAHARAPDRAIRLSTLDEYSETFEPVTVLGDEHRLRQVATNLVNNALQHTPERAQITVRVGCWDSWQLRHTPRPAAAVGGPLPGGSTAVLEVADDGPGVPADHAPRVFERLYRVDPSRSRSQGGSGLGLSIVAAIVYSHGGRVELSGPEAIGATFRVLLPVCPLPS